MTTLTDAQLYIPFKTTLIPTNGSGDPTLTRTSTKTVEDNEGNVKTLKSGAVGLAGARVVQNWFLGSGDIVAHASWVATNFSKTAALDPAGAGGACLLTVLSNASTNIYQSTVQATMSGNKRAYKLLYKPGTLTWLNCRVYAGGADRASLWFNVSTNVIGTTSVGGTGYAHISSSVTASVEYPGWYEFVWIVTVPETGTISLFLSAVDTNGGFGTTAINGTYFTVAWPQLGNTTGQAVQTAGEYVDSSTDYGAGTNGVKYFDTDSSGVAIPDATMLGAQLDTASKTNSMLYCRDLTNAAWVKTNCTPLKTQTGVDGLANGCSLLTATSADATCLQTITTAATAACTGWKVKRSVGTGSVYITRDGGSNWTDITSLINSSTFTLVGIESTSVTNPQVGFKIATSGDAIIVDSGRNHSGTELCEDIFTTTAAVTRAAEALTYQTTGNIRDSQGTIIAKIKRDNWENGNGGVVGSATRGLHTSATSKGVNALDGTNTVTGNAGTPTGQRFIGFRWSGATMKAFAVESFGTEGSYDGALNLSTIDVMPGTQGYIRDLAIYQTALTDVEILQVIGTQYDINRSDDHDHTTSQAPFQYWDDGVSSASYIYHCSAPAGTATSAAGWRIARYEIATGKTMYADGDTKFDNVADDRASLTYSFT